MCSVILHQTVLCYVKFSLNQVKGQATRKSRKIFDEKISGPVTYTVVSKGEMIIKLSGVSATDSVLESSRKTCLDLVNGDVDGNVVTV